MHGQTDPPAPWELEAAPKPTPPDPRGRCPWCSRTGAPPHLHSLYCPEYRPSPEEAALREARDRVVAEARKQGILLGLAMAFWLILAYWWVVFKFKGD